VETRFSCVVRFLTKNNVWWQKNVRLFVFLCLVLWSSFWLLAYDWRFFKILKSLLKGEWLLWLKKNGKEQINMMHVASYGCLHFINNVGIMNSNTNCVRFRSNSFLQNRLVRWGLIILYKYIFRSSRNWFETSNTPPHAQYY
jgi:hypothetical protein